MLISVDTLVTGRTVLRPGWLQTAHDRIVQIGGGPPPSQPDVSLGPAIVVPGFVDTHVHGGGGGTFAEATLDDTRAAVNLHARHGTTTMIASLMSASPADLINQVAVLSDHTSHGLIAGIHLEGPWLAPTHKGAHDPSTLRPPDISEVRAVLDAGRGAIRMVTVAPELDGALKAIDEFATAGVVAAIGHTNATYRETCAAIDAGATVATHLFNAMRPIHHREPGPVVALLEDARVTVELIGDGVHLDAALTRMVGDLVGPDRVTAVTDAMAAAGMGSGTYKLGPLPVSVEAGVARIAGTETIAGSTVTMDRLFRATAQGASRDPDTALVLAVRQTSINPARALGLVNLGLSDEGLAVGSVADLVVLNAALDVDRVMRRGRWVSRTS